MSALMLDLHGCEIDAEETEILQHPMVGGLILFSRNFDNVKQLTELTRQIKKTAKQPILIAVDQEGGRVQRFRQGFSPIPAMHDLHKAKLSLNTTQLCTEMGWLMASEMQSVGIDLSFAPVLDLNGISEVIMNRAFHSQTDKVIEFASAFIQGMKQAGMKATGKHFPGHGSVKADSHIAAPIDTRPEHVIFSQDMQVFSSLIAQNDLDAIMPAHVIYSQVDDKPAGFSPHWLQHILRKNLAFNGVIFSDDLSMQAANIAGDYVGKAQAALSAGCDMILACNNRSGAVQILDQHQTLQAYINKNSDEKIKALLSQYSLNKTQLEQTARWQQANRFAQRLTE